MQYEEKLPLHVLSGFLGSGKTTLLKGWLAQQDLNDIALLVNEFGEVGIDHHLLNEVAPDTVLLPSGCVCCQIRGELKTALIDLYERRARGQLPPFKQVILETTGLADPAPILSTLLHDRQLQHHFTQGTLVTLVDAEHATMQADTQPEWLAQVSAADKLLLSKGDRVTKEARTDMLAWLRQLNPLAQLNENEEAMRDPLSLFSQTVTSGSRQQRFRWLGACASDGVTLTPIAHSTSHPVTQTCVITLHQTINWPAFAIWLSMLLHCHGRTVLRMKGILRVSDSSAPVVIHGVQHTLHPPVHLADWPGELESSKLVFILRGLEADRLQQAFRRYLQAFEEP
ncbi:CobW family GTP-binding protein [Pantoea cypripedii]|uniref:Cobalamin biosynthesis protein CobW n=1 Tax=Pantoea cypripedii TaxID=55209 RepID=A0A1X1EGE7_PANCY|nr:GTP-binding protein [Pantoea cypripedii]MBP2199739.1 G3E family GTPase [Pantoea cypripedii]ORM87991.1 cobalamin biosynthesis protein CobW [Pantoea cypripedii]